MWKRFLAVYEKIEDIIAGIGLVCGVGIMFVGVVARYIFHHPLTFVDEIGPIFIVWSTLIGYSIALRKDEHIKIVMTIGIQVGQLTPPVGINLFQVAGMQKESVASVIRGAVPFLLLLMVVWVLVIFCPGLTAVATTLFT